MNKRRFQFFMFVSLLIVMLLTVSSVGAAPKDGPVVTLSTSQTEFSASQEVLITVSYSNPTRHSIRILQWFTPVNGLEEPVFDVKVDGEPVAYTGAIYKRPAATGNDYITLKAGQSIAYTVNLGGYYDLSASGQYEIYYNAASYYLYSEKGNGASNPDYLSSTSISLKVDGRTPMAKPGPTPTPPPPGGNAYDACSVTQQNILVNARAQAQAYASEAEGYLLPGFVTGTTRYPTWFGAYTSSRFNTVTSHFTALHTAWDTAGVTFHCGCKQNYYAYVYPTKPYEIWLCKVFWTAPLKGTDSQGGTLIHEMSHFNVVASTNDYVYGQSGAMNLAITDPNKAINNADNHEYFAENNPQLK